MGHCAIRLFICDVVSMCVFQAVEHWDIARVLDRLDVDAAWGYVKTCKRYAGVLTDELAVSGWTCVHVSVFGDYLIVSFVIRQSSVCGYLTGEWRIS